MSNEGDLEYYIVNKALVNDVKQGPAIKRSGPFAGLRNHGATCYLNSLIQCLFHDKDFVKLVLETNDNKDSPIIAELQKLFARLMLSASQAIDTEQLLAAFGWSKSQMFEQHDIHELFSVLLDALGKESNHLNSEISKLFQGRLNDVLTCSSCAHVSRTASTFLNFSLDMPESDAATRCELKDLIRTHLQPEILDAENMWQCSGCNEKVRASKGQEYLQLPGMMMLHLKRFRYDPVLKRRRKLTTPVHFPLTLDANELFTPTEREPKKGSYRLTGVVLHSGTAMGGHYRCYVYTADPVTSVPVWVDCNDANVTVLTEEDVNKMLAPPQSVDEAVAPKGSFVHDNVYMLLYKEVQDVPASTTEELKQLLSAQVVEEIERENASFAERIRLQEIKAQVVDLTVRIHPIDTPVENSAVSVQLDVYQQTTLAAALAQVHALLLSTNKLDGAVYPLEHCRLRKYGKRSSTILGESFEGREGTVTLQDISLHGAATLGLEVRTAQDAAFVEFNPFDMNLTFTVWSAETDATVAENATGTPGVKKDVLVPGREASTVGALREAVAQSLQVATSCVVLIHDDPAKPIELLSVDSNTLVAQHQIYPGDISVVVEVLPHETFASVAFPLLENKRKQAVIYYNNPLTSTSTGTADEQPTEADASSTPASAANRDGTYSQSIEVSLDLTLAAVKALIAPTLNITDLNSFFCKRSGAASAPQLKDENKTLKELAFVSHSVLHLQMGPGCKVGEHMVRVEIDTSSPTSALQALDPTATSSATSTSTASAGIAGGVAEAAGGIAGAAAQVFVALGDVAVSEKLSVLQLKQLLCDQWSALASRLSPTDAAAVPTPISANHIRLRDGKAGKSSGPLRDDRIVGRCLLGLADGRRLVAQVLSEAEFISADDLVISLRVASFERKVLYPAIDLPITRTSTIKALYEKILTLVPQLNEPLPAEYIESVPAEPEYQETISIAKGFTTGPALTLKSAFKLKWDDPAVLKALVDPTAASAPALAAAPTTAPANPASTAGTAEGEEEGTMDPAGVPTDGLLNNPFGLDRPPLNLRDGSIVVVRSKADFWRVEQVLKARRAEEIAAGGDGAPRRPTTAGTGVAAARNRKSVKARVAAANAGMMASESGGEDEVLVKGAPQKSNNGIVRSGTENSLKIATGGSNKAEE